MAKLGSEKNTLSIVKANSIYALRLLSSADADLLCTLRLQVVAESPGCMGFSADERLAVSRDEIERELSPDSFEMVVGCFSDGRLIGSAGIWPSGRHGPWADVSELSAVAVTPIARGRGIAKSLVAACIERSRQLGVRWINLAIFLPNEAALALYRSCGFLDYPNMPEAASKDGEKRMVHRMTLPPPKSP